MSQVDTAHAWWSRSRHQGMLLSPVVQVDRYPSLPPTARFPLLDNLRNAYNRFVSSLADLKENADRDEATILKWVDALLEKYVECGQGQIAKQHDVRINVTAPVRIGSRTETVRPHRVVFADATGTKIALLVMADTSPHVGRGRGRTAYARFLELLRATGHRVGLLTNGSQFRLIYAGLDFEAWAEWESERWFDGGEGTEELNGLRQLLSPESVKVAKSGASGLLDAIEESRKRQADLSGVLRENVRQAVELILEDVSTSHRTNPDLFASLFAAGSERPLTDAEAHEALLQATVRIVMRQVVCLFAESRQLLPVNDPIYDQSYGVRTLYEQLEDATRYEGSTQFMFNRHTAWPRLMSLCRLIHGGSAHGTFPMRAYGGVLFRPGEAKSLDPVARALHILEHAVSVSDATIYYVLRKMLRGPLPVIKGHQPTIAVGPVDYTNLRTEFIGLIYEGLLDYRLKRTDEQTGPQVFLNLGREPVLPLARLRDMLENDRKGLKELLTTLKKEKVTASVESEEEEAEEDDEEQGEVEEETTEEVAVVPESAVEQIQRPGDYLDSVEAANCWAREAVVLVGLIGKQTKRETDSQYQTRIVAEATKLINRVVAPGEFYLVRAGNTRKGTGTFYTRPQLAVPTVHRTLEPLCYDSLPSPAGSGAGGKGGEDQITMLVPKTPEDILALKVCDPACGSASFPVAALHYLTEALYKSLCHHRKLDDPSQAKRLTIPYGRPKNGSNGDELLPFPPDDPERGELFPDRVKALLRRHVVERCIYGVDINPLAVELARVSLWVETLDPDLPFSFLDHKIKVGNSLVGCWLDRVEDYPLKAWEREGGDGPKGERTQRIEEFLKGPKIGKKRSGDGRIKKEMREVIESRFSKQIKLFPDQHVTADQVVAEARNEYEKLHSLPIADPDERERYYREHVQASPALRRLKQAMDEWCAVWFWPTDFDSLACVPTPLSFHKPSGQVAKIVEQLAGETRFFHWELEFPDVFTSQRYGFDVIVGNPPWDILKPNSLEFFSYHDPGYRSYLKAEALEAQKRLFATDATLHEEWIRYNARFKSLRALLDFAYQPFEIFFGRSQHDVQLTQLWKEHLAKREQEIPLSYPFLHQGAGDINAFKMFLEQSHAVLRRDGGSMGYLVPSALYTDKGCSQLRSLFLSEYSWEWLFGFENRTKVFPIHASFKFISIVVRKGSRTEYVRAAFMRTNLQDFEHPHRCIIPYTRDQISYFCPQTLAFMEFRSPVDAPLSKSLFGTHPRLNEIEGDMGIGAFGRELHKTYDRSKFTLRKTLVEGGILEASSSVRDPRVRARLFKNGYVPVYEGRCSFFTDFYQEPERYIHLRYNPSMSGAFPFAFRRISSNTNRRALVVSPILRPGCTLYSWTVQRTMPRDVAARNYFFMASFVLDYLLRFQVSASVPTFCAGNLPIPSDVPQCVQAMFEQYAQAFEDEPFSSLSRFIDWPIIDAVVAHCFGLSITELEHILGTFPVLDKKLPIHLRQTTLTLAAYESLNATGLETFCSTRWEPPEQVVEWVDKEVGRWAPVGGWADAWAEVREMLSDEELRVFTGTPGETKSEPVPDGEPFQLKADKPKPNQKKMF